MILGLHRIVLIRISMHCNIYHHWLSSHKYTVSRGDFGNKESLHLDAAAGRYFGPT